MFPFKDTVEIASAKSAAQVPSDFSNFEGFQGKGQLKIRIRYVDTKQAHTFEERTFP